MGEGSVQLLFLMIGSSIDSCFQMVYPLNSFGIIFSTRILKKGGLYVI